MSASLSDKITDTFNATNPNVAKVTSSRAGAVTTLTCDSLAGWPTASKVHFSTYQVDVSGNYVDGTQIDWVGIVTSSTTIGSLTRVAGASDSGNSIGDYVEMNPTAKWAQDLADGFTLEHSRAGVHALTSNSTIDSSTITTPKIATSLNDTNGNELFKVSPTSSAVNEFTVKNAATGNAPEISATGNDTNIDFKVTPKGTGKVVLNGAGAAQSSTVATSESSSSTSYTALTTASSVTVTIGNSGVALVVLTATLSNDTANANSFMGFAVSGANTIAATDTKAIQVTQPSGGGANSVSAVFVLTGLTAGSTTFTTQFRVGSHTGTWANRNIAVLPQP